MAFVIENNNVVSFAEMQDVLDRDQRLFDSNEGLSEPVVTPLLNRATERILTKIRKTDWWASLNGGARPAVDPNNILERQNDFTDLCVYQAMAEYILPIVADFGTEDNAERQKMMYYQQKADMLFAELIGDGSWYDVAGDGQISESDRKPGIVNLKRIR